MIFHAGDDVLIKGNFTRGNLEAIQDIYATETKELTCSIGYGKSFQEVYLALKLAKSKPGKNEIMGILLV